MFAFPVTWPLAMPVCPPGTAQGSQSGIVQTQQQERVAGDNSAWYDTYRRIKTLKSKRSLWRLRQEKPELFKQQDQLESHLSEHEGAAPRGFVPSGKKGWLYNPEKRIYLEESTGHLSWLDEATNTYQDLYEGDTLPFSFASAAATRQAQQAGEARAAAAASAASVRGRAPSAATPAASSTSQPPGPKHVAIPDLHRAAEALKVDIDHLDRPTAMLAIFVPAGAEALPADAAACALHKKLLRRLGAFRGEWTDHALQQAVAGALDDLAADHGGARPCGAAALAIGERIIAAATPGARFSLSVRPSGAPPGASSPAPEASGASAAPAPTMEGAPAPSAPTAVACSDSALAEDCREVHVALVAGGLAGAGGAASGSASAASIASPHLLLGRPRAASIALLRAQRELGARGPLAAACARLGLAPGAVEAAAARPPAKRQRGAEPTGKVRVRQVLLRHAGSTRPTDPVRKRAVKRSLEEAEEEMLGVLTRLESGGIETFPAVCRSLSECQSALKGGELAGDLGWLDCGAGKEQEKGKEAVRTPLPAAALKAASALRVGELGDLVCSEVGVHLLQRTA